MIPVVGARPDDHEVLTASEFSVAGPLSGEADDGVSVYAGVLLLPGRCVGHVLVVVALCVVAFEAARHPEAGHGEIEHGGHRHPALGGLDIADRHASPDGGATAEVVEVDRHRGILVVDETQAR